MAAETKKTQKGDRNAVLNFVDGARNYFAEVRTELNKVSWPDRETVARLTRIVLLTTILSSLVLGAASLVFSLYIEEGVNRDYGWVLFALLLAIALAAAGYLFRRENSVKTRY